MEHRNTTGSPGELDELRLFALGRIPRCTGCPRFRALQGAQARGGTLLGPLPSPPTACSHHVCAPIVDRVKRAGMQIGNGRIQAWACNC